MSVESFLDEPPSKADSFLDEPEKPSADAFLGQDDSPPDELPLPTAGKPLAGPNSTQQPQPSASSFLPAQGALFGLPTPSHLPPSGSEEDLQAYYARQVAPVHKEISEDTKASQVLKYQNYPEMGKLAPLTEDQQNLNAYVPGLANYDGTLAEGSKETQKYFKELTGSDTFARLVGANKRAVESVFDLAAPLWKVISDAGQGVEMAVLKATGQDGLAKLLDEHPGQFAERINEGAKQLQMEIAQNPKLGEAARAFSSIGLELVPALISDPGNTIPMLMGLVHETIKVTDKGASKLQEIYTKLKDEDKLQTQPEPATATSQDVTSANVSEASPATSQPQQPQGSPRISGTSLREPETRLGQGGEVANLKDSTRAYPSLTDEQGDIVIRKNDTPRIIDEDHKEWTEAIPNAARKNEIKLRPEITFFDPPIENLDQISPELAAQDPTGLLQTPGAAPWDITDKAKWQPVVVTLTDHENPVQLINDPRHFPNKPNVNAVVSAGIVQDPKTGQKRFLIYEVQAADKLTTDLPKKELMRLGVRKAVQIANGLGLDISLIDGTSSRDVQKLSAYTKAVEGHSGEAKGLQTTGAIENRLKKIYDGHLKQVLYEETGAKPVPGNLGQPDAMGHQVSGRDLTTHDFNYQEKQTPKTKGRLYTGLDPELLYNEFTKLADLTKTSALKIAEIYHQWSVTPPPVGALARSQAYEEFRNSVLFDREKDSARPVARPILRGLLDPTNNRLVIPAFRDSHTGKLFVGDTAHFPLAGELDQAGVALDKLEPGFVFPSNGKFQLKNAEPNRLDRPPLDLGQVNIGIPIPSLGAVKRTYKTLQEANKKVFNAIFSPLGSTEDLLSALHDAKGNITHNYAREVYNWTKLNVPEVNDRNALPFVIESGGKQKNLIKFMETIQNSKTISDENKLKYIKILEHAQDNWQQLRPLADTMEEAFDRQGIRESEHGVPTERMDNYVTHLLDAPLWKPDGGVVLRGQGIRAAFLKSREFPDFASAIAEGYVPKTTDIADLLQHRTRAGEAMVQEELFVDYMKGIKTSSDKPLAVEPTYEKRTNLNTGQTYHTAEAPEGYQITKFGLREVAINNDYAGFLKFLRADSLFNLHPVGSGLVKFAQTNKHLTLVADAYHLSKMLERAVTFTNGKAGWKKGLAILEYSHQDIQEAYRQKLVTKEMVEYHEAYRDLVKRGEALGLNVGRISDAMHKDIVQKIPLVGEKLGGINKFIFEKATRGIMTEAFVDAYHKNKIRYPELSEEQVTRRTAKEVNQYFGNLMSQGIFKNSSLQDLLRVTLLAPQWVESMATSELKSWAQLGKVPMDLATKRRLRVGALAQGTAKGVAAVLIANQIASYYFNGHSTFTNPEQGHDLDLIMPMGKVRMAISPFAIHAELTHDVIRLMEKYDNPERVLRQIGSNKLSALSRVGEEALYAKDAMGKPFNSRTDEAIALGLGLTPIPLAVSSTLRHKEPAALPRQLFGMGGIKSEPILGATPEIGNLARAFIRENFPKVEKTGPFPTNPYKDLRTALFENDIPAAKGYIKALQKEDGKSEERIRETFSSAASKPFTGSHIIEAKFIRSLTPAQKQMFQNARTEQREAVQRLNQAFREIKQESKL